MYGKRYFERGKGPNRDPTCKGPRVMGTRSGGGISRWRAQVVLTGDAWTVEGLDWLVDEARVRNLGQVERRNAGARRMRMMKRGGGIGHDEASGYAVGCASKRRKAGREVRCGVRLRHPFLRLQHVACLQLRR